MSHSYGAWALGSESQLLRAHATAAHTRVPRACAHSKGNHGSEKPMHQWSCSDSRCIENKFQNNILKTKIIKIYMKTIIDSYVT